MLQKKKGIDKKSNPSKILKKVDVIQFRNLIKKYLCRTFEKFCFVIINGKKNYFVQNTNGENLLIYQIVFPTKKKPPNFKQPFLFRQHLLKLLLFNTNGLYNGFHFLHNGNNFHVFGIKIFDGSFQLRFHTNFGFFQTFY